LSFFFSAATSVFLGLETRLFFGATTFSCFGAELRFNLRSQASFFLRAVTGLLFRLPSSGLFSAATPSFFGQELRFLFSFQASLFTRLHPLDFLFDGAKPGFRTSSQFIFLSAFPGFRFQIVTLFFGALARLFFFSLAQRGELCLVGLLSNPEMSFGFMPTLFFNRSERPKHLFGAGNFFSCDLSSLFFFGAFAGFGIDPPAFVLSALARNFLFLLPPSFLLNS
jgi:hypothetical protein